MRGEELFRRGVGFKVGERSRVHFWVDHWVGLGPLSLSFPRLFRLVVNKLPLVKDCYVGEGGFGSWDVSFKRVLRSSKESEFGSLKNLLSNIFFWRDIVDSRIWMTCSSSAVSCRSFYKELEGFPSFKASASLARLGLAPPRVEAFMWLALSRKVSMADNLRRTGLTSVAISDICMICGKDNETVDH